MIPSDDSFISDEEDEFCPLCVEEMDISDKNFKPCPCGYQICQFCYNNIRQNPELNGRCPGCRRLYDDESVEYKSITAEEYKLQQIRKEKRDKERKQREKEKKETEMANKKHLAGLRVVQKNLVYVTGLNPPCNPEELHSVLRSDKYFGQYGKILKIVINKKAPNQATGHHHHQSPGLVVYVTFSRKEDASKCISELDGSLCDGRVLRAAHGTTKYCSSYLRGHTCPNPNCMFLHEPGEEADSYTRKDLSTQQGIKMGMMGLSGSAAGSRNVSGAHQHHPFQSDEDAYSEDDVSTDPSTPVRAAATTNTSGPVLPATAHWAKANNSASASPSVNNNAPLANAAAFPTLGEIFKEQKTKKDPKQKLKPSKSKDSNIILPDDFDVDDDSAIQFCEETADYLKSLSEKNEQLKVHFKSMSNRTLPLFVFNKNDNYSTLTKLEDEKLLARQVIEKYILKPLKNYHLSYQNHPVTQQQSLLQQHVQLQQQQGQQLNQTPNLYSAQLQQLQLEQQKKLLAQQSQPAENTLQQQQQQLLLLQQLQQQQQQQQQTPSQTQAQINALKMNVRSNNTPTPPPPGLFNAKSQASNGQHSQQYPLQFPQQYTQHPQMNANGNGNGVSSAGAPSSSSQLLTQLMSGKR